MQDKIQATDILPPVLRKAALTMLEDLPEGHQLCHGDFHPDNVLLTEERPVIIDWIDATYGNPLADVAQSSLLITKAPLPEDKRMRWVLDASRKWFRRAYLRHYFHLRPGDRQELARAI